MDVPKEKKEPIRLESAFRSIILAVAIAPGEFALTIVRAGL